MRASLLATTALALTASLAVFALLAPASAESLIPAEKMLPVSCPAASKTLSKLSTPLSRVSARLRAGEPVVIVAIGSSSTAGAGATDRANSYPSRLQAMLRERFPGADIKVINRGANGQDAPEMLARFDADVVPLKPTLVLWQAGVNALFRENGMATAELLLREAIARTKAIGADMMLIDPQYAPRVLADEDIGPMIRLIDTIGTQEGVGVYHRFALMREWRETSKMAFDTFLWKDSFHMNDWGYDCFARDLGRAMAANIDAQQRSADVKVDAMPRTSTSAIPATSAAAAVATPTLAR